MSVVQVRQGHVRPVVRVRVRVRVRVKVRARARSRARARARPGARARVRVRVWVRACATRVRCTTRHAIHTTREAGTRTPCTHRTPEAGSTRIAHEPRAHTARLRHSISTLLAAALYGYSISCGTLWLLY